MTTPRSPSLIGHPGLFSFISARALSAFAIQILGVAVGWQIYAITHSAASLGFVGLAQFLPMLICVFHAGYAADRYNRKYIVLCCEIFEALTASVMAYASFIKALTPTEWPVWRHDCSACGLPGRKGWASHPAPAGS